jgi:sulfate transport system permease protein
MSTTSLLADERTSAIRRLTFQLPRFKQHSVLPGFGLTLGFTLLYLSLVVLIPLAAMFLRLAGMSLTEFWNTVTTPRVVASLRLTFSTSLIAASINALFGFIVAWSLVRYRFPGRKLIDALIDLPFALPTAVSGIALAALYTKNGWIGQYFELWNKSNARQSLDKVYQPVAGWITAKAPDWIDAFIPADTTIKTAFSPLGITIALVFIGLPFVVRTLQPAIEELDGETEEAAASLGANRWQTFLRVIVPSLLPPLLTGYAMAFARALGEYGSVVFIAGNQPMKTEITSLLIVTKLEQYDYTGAAALAVVMLLASFVLLLLINLLQWWSGRSYQRV